ncbi:MAG: metal-sensitive transcriptional regulator [Actinomycetaceae bacterium]|nr:metal-sensitive transcriptional regulator [Actinomycetaceae bacterium]
MSHTLHLDSEQRRAVRNRLARARGQLDAIMRSLDEDHACLEVLPQMIAANKAVDRATYTMILAAIDRCATDPQSHADESEQLRKLFLSLA